MSIPSQISTYTIESGVTVYEQDETQVTPATYRLWYIRGKLLAKQGCYEAALTNFDTALSLQPNEHRIWIFRGVMLAHLTHYESALASFNEAVRIVCDDRQAWIFRGAILSYLNRHAEAHKSYTIALAMRQSKTEDYPMWVPPCYESGF